MPINYSPDSEIPFISFHFLCEINVVGGLKKNLTRRSGALTKTAGGVCFMTE